MDREIEKREKNKQKSGNKMGRRMIRENKIKIGKNVGKYGGK